MISKKYHGNNTDLVLFHREHLPYFIYNSKCLHQANNEEMNLDLMTKTQHFLNLN